MKKGINRVLCDMQKLTSENDIEKVHYEAGILLIDLIAVLSEHSDLSKEIEEIIEIYNKLDKWYA